MIRDFKTLLFMKFAQFKNRIKNALANPITAIRELGAFMFPFIFIFISFLGGKSKRKPLSHIEGISKDIIGIGIIVILLLIVLYILFKASRDYKPLNFSIQDVHYLFPSPIGEKSLWIFSILFGALGFIVSYFFIAVIIWMVFLKSIKVSLLKLAISSLGVGVIHLFFKSLNFMLYSIKVRYNAEKIVKIISKLFVAGIFLYVFAAFWFYGNKSFLQTVSIISSGVPILSWMKDIIIYPLTTYGFPIMEFSIVLAITVILFVGSVVFAVDYYESVSENVELNNINIEDLNLDKMVLEESVNVDEKKIKPVKETFLHRVTGEGAFLYKNSLLFKRKSSFIKRTMVYLTLVIIFGGLGYILRNFPKRSELQLIIALMGMSVSIGVNPVSSIKYELTKTYIYLMPGSVKKKIMYIIFHDYRRSVITLISVIIPLAVMARINILTAVLYILALLLINLAKGLSKIVVHFFIPVDDKGGGGIIEAIVQYIVFLVPIIIGVFIYFATKNTYITLISIGGLGFIFVMLILYLSENLFSHVELR
ncbi:putative ABC exporter domain-containing protein [Haloimpatiens lingqiaonensis]|uniref:putative ABC exporter domain-containing protein n=1 Tax=Haloimpatiens lingqiaonensis TaxID=1380675 RepID=UPI0010FCFAD0|nr:putative ABC exporter domain-containing protein [Haloimpatiens lingqiaonensis]